MRLWGPTKQLAISAQLNHDPTALDWSPDGNLLAVGDRNGSCLLLDANTLAVLGTYKGKFTGKPHAWIEDIKFSPDGRYIAYGTHGGLSPLEIVEVQPNKKLKKYATANVGLTSALTHLDWSQDGETIMVNSQANELMFISLGSKKQITASATKGTEWATMTCLFGWPVQGIWPGLDYTDVNTTCRSRNGLVLATGDDFGVVKLFKYPCVKEKAGSTDHYGHSSHVTGVKFTADDTLVVSTGGNDKTVFVWDTDFNDDDQALFGVGGGVGGAAQ